MIFEFRDYHAFLRSVLHARSEKNPRFSLRGFARQLGVSSTSLSAVLNGKRGLSLDRGQDIGKKLRLSVKELEYFKLLILHESVRDESLKEEITAKLDGFEPALQKRALSAAEFEVLSDWRYFAYLIALDLDLEESDLDQKIVASLRLTANELALLKDRLLRLGLVRRDAEKGRLEKVTAQMLTDGASDRESILSFHEKWTKVTLEAIRTHKSRHRFSGSEWVTLDAERYEAAKRILSDAMDAICALSEKAGNTNRLYGLSLHFFQLLPMPAAD